jgi:hypothetical protein
MSLEWFDRVCGELQDHMESICDKYDELGHISIDRASKHPNVDFFVENEENDREVFCTIFFDPYNEEFYIEEFDLVLEQTSRTILPDMEDIVDAVHESFHEYMNGDDLDDEFLLDDDEDLYVLDEDEDDNDYVIYTDGEDDDDYFEEDIHVEWTTPEVTAFVLEGEAEVAYQFGVVQETGDGVLRRVNRIMTNEETMVEDESSFFFSREEAGTIVDLIEGNYDLMEENHS